MKAPKGWRIRTLEEVAAIQTGLSKSASRTGDFVRLPYLRVANVQDGHFNLSEIKEIDVPKEAVARFSVVVGDLLLTEGGDFDKLGRGAIWNGAIPNCVHQNHIFVVRANEHVLERRFLAMQTQSAHGRAYFQSCSKQSTNLASINSSQLKQFPVLLPPLPEQQKIADILGTWDEAREKLDALIAAKARRKQALMQQLLTGHRRLPGFSNKWKRRPFSEFLTESRVPVAQNDANHRLTVCLHLQGIQARDFRMSESTDATVYYERKAGQFIYGKQNIHKGALGIIPSHLDSFHSTQDVPAFDYKGECNPRWFFFLVSRPSYYSQLETQMRGTGSKRLAPDLFLELEAPTPSIDEQRAIAAVLDTADAELRLLRQHRAAFDLQKWGLMQQLLTGRFRVSP